MVWFISIYNIGGVLQTSKWCKSSNHLINNILKKLNHIEPITISILHAILAALDEVFALSEFDFAIKKQNRIGFFGAIIDANMIGVGI